MVKSDGIFDSVIDFFSYPLKMKRISLGLEGGRISVCTDIYPGVVDV